MSRWDKRERQLEYFYNNKSLKEILSIVTIGTIVIAVISIASLIV